ncbi:MULTISPECIES: hypothetical protein [unclassified Moorena]|uniref:hypothetical protein n=1 Tax=unclassified Moorena TaxID=2683338 RepID=UPI0013C6FB16|nr:MULTISPECIES: hypothetical protein [unclassified Moorena]NEO11960.1 hypothetical protein [Moorena sp. SIO3E8]NEO24150.1 hypothetical protein [Moorena sp. SIO4A5]NEO46383.1 hypothetical protein [Moorena sp. SIO4A3]NEP99009.1 hypothetical protein [Moorena sp. SIO3F7]
MGPDSRFPIPDSRFPIPHSRFPIPDSRFPIPHSRFPITYLQSKKPTPESPAPPLQTLPLFPVKHF